MKELMEKVYTLVLQETIKANENWPLFNSDLEGIAVIEEEVVEAISAKENFETFELDIYTTEQFQEDMKLLEKMCEHTVCADCPFSSRSCATSDIDLNELRAWAEAERAKIKELHSGKLCGKNADIMIIDDPIAKGGTK